MLIQLAFWWLHRKISQVKSHRRTIRLSRDKIGDNGIYRQQKCSHQSEQIAHDKGSPRMFVPVAAAPNAVCDEHGRGRPEAGAHQDKRSSHDGRIVPAAGQPRKNGKGDDNKIQHRRNTV